MPLSKARNRDRMNLARGYVQPRMSRKYLTIEERKELLSEIATNGSAKAASPVEAVKELNRMEGVYPPQQHLVAQKVIFEIVHTDRKALPNPDETKPSLEQNLGGLLDQTIVEDPEDT